VYTYEANTVWQRGKQGSIHVAGKPEIEVATPPEFGGPSDVWSPEQLFVASVDSCLMSTFLFFAEKSAIKMHSYNSVTVGRMDKTPDGLRFTAIDVSITVSVDADSELEKTTRLQAKLEKYCPISTSLRCPVTLSLKVAAREGHEH
jgi:organic hydroperoxide reductase OsmC/OhrA